MPRSGCSAMHGVNTNLKKKESNGKAKSAVKIAKKLIKKTEQDDCN